MYTIIYSSPTGNVLHLGKKLANHLKPENVTIHPLEFTEPDKLLADTYLVLIQPVHGFNAPRTVPRFVKNLPSGLFTFVSILGVSSDN